MSVPLRSPGESRILALPPAAYLLPLPDDFVTYRPFKAERPVLLAFAIFVTDVRVVRPLAALRFTMLRAADCSAPVTATLLAMLNAFRLSLGIRFYALVRRRFQR